MDGKLRWEDVGYREYLETTTERMQYCWAGKDSGYSVWLESANRCVGSKDTPWFAEIKPLNEWIFVGEFHSGKTAKLAAIEQFRLATEAKNG